MEKMFEVLTNRSTDVRNPEPRRTKPFRESDDAEEGMRSQALEKLDFKYYTVAAPGTTKLEVRDKSVLPAHRKSLAQPAREVALNLYHIAPNLVTLHDQNLEASEQYDTLALRLITATTVKMFKRLLITSAQKGEGRTSVLLNMAGALARAGKRVLVVDTDLLRPSVMRLLGLEAEIGLA